ncbi:putative Phosphatidylinositol N-acetylglucosaminyltransferase [Nitrosotalea devaniterrae]|uniref:Putative Phosphatidylinositol N-acetylglucosaminyltransferase n=1 Tax=Nitrosotalea devaniterrae TaxID=1078905 RepID=A0A128A0L1_9ARCH|nr:putative Phosphatidylinositol N-acetylglucosaminyltransferase [Candidatus Nitrosotalea devanaterra]
MKIALLIQRFPGGGAESYVEEIAKRLYSKGEDVTVITSKSDHDDSQYGFRIIRLPSRFSLGEYSWWQGLDNILKKEKFDLVHTNTYGYFHSDKAAALKKKLGYKLVMTSHGFTGMDMHNLKKIGMIKKSSKFDFIRPFYDNYIGKKTLKSCDHLIALSKKDFQYYQKIGIEESKITTIMPGVKDEFFIHDDNQINGFRKKLDADPILLSVGELSWVKNHELLVKAIPYILEKKPSAKLFIMGKDGGEFGNLTTLCKKLGISEKVIFVGPKKPNEVSMYMRSANLLVHTSLAEGVSTVLLESMVSGLPFITTPAGGNEFLADQSHAGMTVSFGNEKSLSNTILVTLDDKEKMRLLSIDGINFSKNLSWNITYLSIYEIYEKLLK